jgi:hypothetical protein
MLQELLQGANYPKASGARALPVPELPKVTGRALDGKPTVSRRPRCTGTASGHGLGEKRPHARHRSRRRPFRPAGRRPRDVDPKWWTTMRAGEKERLRDGSSVVGAVRGPKRSSFAKRRTSEMSEPGERSGAKWGPRMSQCLPKGSLPDDEMTLSRLARESRAEHARSEHHHRHRFDVASAIFGPNAAHPAGSN